ncbi:methylenetetrahydrofolate reductase [bacterium]|nr:methylenetetrahydrofolate reductase [NAD(P)H] [bacterium]
MKLSELYNTKKRTISFEVFPPDTDEKCEKLYLEMIELAKFKPDFISLTYGAGGKNDVQAKEVLNALHERFEFEIMPHLTCVCSNKKFIDESLNFLKQLGTENILALRGDKPNDSEITCTDFHYANELVEYLKAKTNFSIAVAGYPEGHIESKNIEDDIKNLKKKINAGGDAIFTQLFFDNDKFYKYKELVINAGITKPIIAGIMPILNLKQLQKMTTLANVSIPKKLLNKIEEHSEDSNYIKELGIEFASVQCEDLLANETNGLHFFTLNKSYSTSKILTNIL